MYRLVSLLVMVAKRPASSKELFPDCLKIKHVSSASFILPFMISRAYWGSILPKGQKPLSRTPTWCMNRYLSAKGILHFIETTFLGGHFKN